MSPMVFTTLLLLLAPGTGLCAIGTTETDTTTTETTVTFTTETTAETTAAPMTAAPNIPSSINTGGSRTPPSFPSYVTIFPAMGNNTNFQPSISSPGNTTANGTMMPVPRGTAISRVNASANGPWITPSNASTTNSSSAAPTSPMAGGTAIPTTSAKANRTSTAIPTRETSVTAQRSTAPRQTPTAVLGSSGSSNPSDGVLHPTAIQLLLRIPLSFRIINRSFNESLRDPTSKEYRSLSHAVLTMFEHVFGCASCKGREAYKGCSELRFSQGSVEVQSTLVFGHGNDTITSTTTEQQLRKSLDQNGFIMDLQLASIRSTAEVMSSTPVPVVPDWAIALLVLVCLLLLFNILTCFLMTTCTCRRKSRGKLDLLSTKDSYHPMAEYAPYQSHGRYVSPNTKPNPYSQVAGSNSGGTGTFTYTNPTSGSDNL